MTNICCISDPHEQWMALKIPKCDLLICAGDITYRGDIQRIREFNNWCAWLQDEGVVKDVIAIAGNHDITAQTNPEEFREAMKDVTYLCDEACEFEGLKIYGTPWSPSFFKEHWVFNADRGDEIFQKWKMIPDDIDILVVHGPPYNHGDLCDDGRRVGCIDLADRIEGLPKLKYVICGHIHSGRGRFRIKNTEVMVINASVCTEKYKPTNPPIMISAYSES